MTKGQRKVKVDLVANESLTVEVPIGESSGEPMFAKLYLWLRTSGNLARMSGAACKMYCAILTRADFDGLDCYPSQNRIAADAGISRRVVSSATRELMELGLISKISGRSKLGNKVNRYVIIKPPLVQKSRKACAGKSQGLCKKMADPCAEIAHKQDTINKTHTTTTIAEVGCGGEFYDMILERIERRFLAVAPNANVRREDIAETFERYDERQIVGQFKNCGKETRMWSGLLYWLEDYGAGRAKTKVSMADEVEAEERRAERAKQQAEEPKEQPMSKSEMIEVAKRQLEIAKKDGEEFWVRHHTKCLKNLVK